MLIKEASFIKSSTLLTECPPPEKPEYAFIGRSNVGKSSLINYLTGRNKLAKTSSTPGKTKLINHFLVNNEWYLVDLPGYGWAQVSKTEKAKWTKMINQYLLERPNLCCVFVLVDSRHEPQKIDLDFMQWLGEKEIPFSIVFTKIDKLGMGKLQANVSKYKSILKKTWEEIPYLLISSSTKKNGKEDILDFIQSVNDTFDH